MGSDSLSKKCVLGWVWLSHESLLCLHEAMGSNSNAAEGGRGRGIGEEEKKQLFTCLFIYFLWDRCHTATWFKDVELCASGEVWRPPGRLGGIPEQ